MGLVGPAGLKVHRHPGGMLVAVTWRLSQTEIALREAINTSRGVRADGKLLTVLESGTLG